mmetsp:Transcript_12612/g.32664  ORF Transcript_12612/g.32664 Transcript_12612/m.32664 type:complete len:320 (-) Transcript_12612:175-1134(-)
MLEGGHCLWVTAPRTWSARLAAHDVRDLDRQQVRELLPLAVIIAGRCHHLLVVLVLLVRLVIPRPLLVHDSLKILCDAPGERVAGAFDPTRGSAVGQVVLLVADVVMGLVEDLLVSEAVELLPDDAELVHNTRRWLRRIQDPPVRHDVFPHDHELLEAGSVRHAAEEEVEGGGVLIRLDGQVRGGLLPPEKNFRNVEGSGRLVECAEAAQVDPLAPAGRASRRLLLLALLPAFALLSAAGSEAHLLHLLVRLGALPVLAALEPDPDLEPPAVLRAHLVHAADAGHPRRPLRAGLRGPPALGRGSRRRRVGGARGRCRCR